MVELACEEERSRLGSVQPDEDSGTEPAICPGVGLRSKEKPPQCTDIDNEAKGCLLPYVQWEQFWILPWPSRCHAALLRKKLLITKGTKKDQDPESFCLRTPAVRGAPTTFSHGSNGTEHLLKSPLEPEISQPCGPHLR